jgi:hypothetical protein
MNSEPIMCWNVWGLGSQARRNVVASFVLQERVSIACL